MEMRQRTAYEAEMLDLAKRFWSEAIDPDETDVERLHEALLDNDVVALRALLREHGIDEFPA